MIFILGLIPLFIGLLGLILLFGIFSYWLQHHNDPPRKGCIKGKHDWELIYDHRSKASKYIGSVSLWKEFKCKKCGKKEKTDTGIW